MYATTRMSNQYKTYLRIILENKFICVELSKNSQHSLMIDVPIKYFS